MKSLATDQAGLGQGNKLARACVWGVFLGLSLIVSAPRAAQGIALDGSFADWTSAEHLGVDPSGDVSGGDLVDWKNLWAKFETNKFFVSYETQTNIDFVGNAWRYGVYLDTDSASATGYRGPSGSYAVGADFYIEGATVYQYTGDGSTWSWNSVGTALYAYTGGRIEMSVVGSLIGVTNTSRIALLLVGNNATTPDYARNDKAGYAFPPSAIVVDGTFTDWNAVTPVGTDVQGDVSGGDLVDWVSLRATSHDGSLFLCYQTVANIDLVNHAWRYDAYIDTDLNTNTGFTAVSGGSGAEYLIEGNGLFRYTGTGTNWSWESVAALPYAVASTQMEFAVAESWLNLSGTYNVRLRLLGNNVGTVDYAPAGAPGFSYAHAGKLNITLDGTFGDWSGIAPAGTDPAGDVSGGDLVDWTTLWLYSSTSTLYLSYQTVQNIDMAGNGFRYAVYLDTDNNAATGYRSSDGSFKVGAEYLIEGATLFLYTGNGTSWSWTSQGVVSYALSGKRLEMAVARSSLGLGASSMARVLLYGSNPTTVDLASNDKSGYAVAPRGSVAGASETSQVWWQPATNVNVTGYHVYRQIRRFSGTPSISIDGSFADWSGIRSGNTAPYPPEDPTFISDVWVAHNATDLYLRIRTPTAFSYSRFGVYVYIDADANVATGTEPQGVFGLKIGAEYRLRYNPADAKVYLDPYNPSFQPWADPDSAAWLSATTALSAAQYAIGSDSYDGATLTNNSIEVRLPLSSLGYSNPAGLVGMDFYFDYDGQDFFPTIGYAPGSPMKFEYGYHRVTPTPVTGVSYVDSVVGGLTNDYAVAAVLSSGSQSVIDTSTLYSPAAHPLNFNAYMENQSSLRVSWKTPDDARVTAVRVLRNLLRYPTNEYDGTVIYEGTATNYLDSGLGAATSYYYGAFGRDLSGSYSRRHWDSSDRSVPTYARGPISGLPVDGDYLCYFGFWDTERVRIAEKYDVVVLHPGVAVPVITPAQVRDIQDGVDNVISNADDVKVIAYISIGEDHGIAVPGYALNQPRTNLAAQYNSTNGPCYYDWETGEIRYENHGHQGFYVDEFDVLFNGMNGQTDGYPDQNQEWGSLYVNAGDPLWQAYQKQATSQADGFAGLDYIIHTLQADGFFLDTVGVSAPWTYWNTLFGDYYWIRDGALDYMAKLAYWYPNKIILPNRPMHLCFKDFAGKRHDDFRAFTSAIFWESYSADVNYWWPQRNGQLFEAAVQSSQSNADGRGFTTLGLDYYTIAIEGQDGAYNQAGPWYTTASSLVKRAESAGIVAQLSPSRSLAEMSDDVYLIHHPTNFAGKADLFPLSIFATPVGTNQAQVEIRVSNQGPAATGTPFRVRTRQNNTYLADQIITNLTKWQVYSYFRTITLSNIGNNIHVDVDTDGAVTEFDEANNSRDTLIDELLSPPAPGVVFKPNVPPDVKMNQIDTVPSVPVVGSNFAFQLTFTNLGAGVATASRVYLSLGTLTNSKQIANVEAPYILPGETKLLNFNYSVDHRETYFIGSTADGANELNEWGNSPISEANNSTVAVLVVANSYLPVTDWAADTNVLGPLADASGDGTAGLAAGDILNGWVSEDSDELLFRMQLATNVNFTTFDYVFFLDTDSAVTSGYWVSDLGADYMINDGNLYQFTGGTNQSDWLWTLRPLVDQGLFTVEANPAFLDVTAKKSVLGLPTPTSPVKVFFYVSDGKSETADDSYPGNGSSVRYPAIGGLIRIDGKLSDWSGVSILATDGSNDGYDSTNVPAPNRLGGFVDLQTVWAAYDTNYLYVKIAAQSNINTTVGGYSLFMDTDNSTASGYLLNFSAVGADYRYYNGSLYRFTGTNQTDYGWTITNNAAWTAVGTTNQNQMEIALKRSAMGWLTTNSMGWFFIGTDTKTDPSFQDDISDYLPELGLGSIAYPPRPDLTILSITTAPLNLITGQVATVTLSVRNNGTVASGSFTTRLTAAGAIISNRLVTALAGGATTNFNISWRPAATGNIQVVGFADSWSNVVEASEANNTLTITSVVKGLVGGTIRIDGLLTDWTNTSIIVLGNDGTNDGYNTSGFPVTNQLAGLADILNARAIYDATYLYFRLDLRSNINLSAGGYGIYLDTDRNTNTGYLTSWNTVGADYRFYNGDLYRFTGTNQTDFGGFVQTNNASWFAIANTNEAKMEIALRRTAIGWTTTNAMGIFFNATDNKGPGFPDDINDYMKELGQGGIVYPPRPDLTILSITTAPLNIVSGRVSTVTVSVQNIGSLSAGAFTTRLTAASTVITNQRVASLAVGAITNLVINWTPTLTGNVSLVGFADSWSNVSEAVENNNTSTTNVTVKPLIGGPTYFIDGLLTDWTNAAVHFLGADGTNDGYNFSGFAVTNQLGGFADIQATWAVQDTNCLYVRMDFRSNINFSAAAYTIYIDTDRNTSSGYLANWGTVGADYRFFNGDLYKFTGTNQAEFTWTVTNNAAWYAIANTNQAKMEIAMKRTALNWTTTNAIGFWFTGTDNKGAGFEDDITDYQKELGQGFLTHP